jgi:phosphatidylglycerophosphatase A
MSQPDEKNVGAGFSPPSQEGAASSAPAQPTKPAPKLAIWIATGFGLGYLPIAPGTWGSLGGVVVTLPLWYRAWVPPKEVWVYPSPWSAFLFLQGLAILLVAALGVWSAREGVIQFQKPDPGPVVIDEVSGQQIAYLPLASSAFGSDGWKYLLLGFILFRVLDIVKPWPCKQAERWPHGWGIMADDWFAGLYAAVILWVVQRLGWLG